MEAGLGANLLLVVGEILLVFLQNNTHTHRPGAILLLNNYSKTAPGCEILILRLGEHLITLYLSHQDVCIRSWCNIILDK